MPFSADTAVSIPIGFSSSLQLQLQTKVPDLVVGFNPYRVFKFVATLPQTSASRLAPGFNPYRVFKFVATLLL